ncbi:MAG: class I poly(R)-hydroxyalkanoic acid synthase [Rhodobacter sp.]|nr:class I poly(R)-hydroxyalkanoic acid synthase [Rhodobacter sp.]MCY4167246.1 class I poly(R)-hydroxyalkanoic acid synthase [Rhodobacter sp.]
MTTDDGALGRNIDRLQANLSRIEELSQRMVTALASRRQVSPDLQGPGMDLYFRAAGAWWAQIMTDPAGIMERQVSYWGKTLEHYVEVQKALATGSAAKDVEDATNDRRFSGEMWSAHPYFSFVRQQYLLNAEAVRASLEGLEGLDDTERRRVEFFAGQIIDMFAPTNFLATNPEALSRAVETEGQSLVDGLENLVRDIESSKDGLLVTLADRDAFTVGGNIATTEGAVVYRNRMLELIQYTPTTETVHKVPLVVFPPWINKFYIMDLRPDNSLVRWILDQGFTLFVVSWKDPDDSYADVGIDTYIEEGYLAALEQVRRITDERQVNAVGYCIGGTALAVTLSYLNGKGDNPVRSATFLTTLTDFSDKGEFTPFLTDDFVGAIEAECEHNGVLESFFMARTFSFLRANDLVYGPAVRSYMLGEPPPTFDLLFWNGDGTNLPGRMAVEYLRWLCQENRFSDAGLEILGERLCVNDVRVPLCAIACETDHIADWTSSFTGISRMGSESKTFILSESGHIAGIINPPAKRKYGHFVNDDLGTDAALWKEGAERHDGSWWPRWGEWLATQSGERVPARPPGDAEHPVLAAAPGTYVFSGNARETTASG